MFLVSSGNNWPLFGHQPIIAMPEDQGLAGRVVVEIEHLADEDHMVAALISIGSLAFEDRERVGQDRTAGLPCLVIEVCPLVVERAGEAARQLFLALAQHSDRKMIGREIGFETIGPLAEPPQNE